MSLAAAVHRPVMVREVLAALAPADGGAYVDATFGAGGYAKALLEAAVCTVFGIDRDPDAVAYASDLVHRYGSRLRIILGRFGDMVGKLGSLGITSVDGVAFDLGVSSAQLEEPTRGFSFRLEGPLDMRMDNSGITAADVVNTFSAEDLADIIYAYGEERAARSIARAIVEARARSPITRTDELADLVRRVAPGRRVRRCG